MCKDIYRGVFFSLFLYATCVTHGMLPWTELSLRLLKNRKHIDSKYACTKNHWEVISASAYWLLFQFFFNYFTKYRDILSLVTSNQPYATDVEITLKKSYKIFPQLYSEHLVYNLSAFIGFLGCLLHTWLERTDYTPLILFINGYCPC